jgi:hypothetical protein
MQVRNATSAVVEQPALSTLQPLGEAHQAQVLHGLMGDLQSTVESLPTSC